MKSRTFLFLCLFLIPVSFFLAIYIVFWRHQDPFKEIEHFFKAVALYFAFCFFIYKLVTGWLIINLKIGLESIRATNNQSDDYVVISVNIEKGSTDSLWLKDIQLKVKTLDPQGHELQVETIRPIGFNRANIEISNKEIVWREGTQARLLNISPGETTTFAAHTKIQKGCIAAIEALVLATRPFYGLEKATPELIQWKASTIVLPIVEQPSKKF